LKRFLPFQDLNQNPKIIEVDIPITLKAPPLVGKSSILYKDFSLKASRLIGFFFYFFFLLLWHKKSIGKSLPIK
jgi:hypothetical protein